MSGLSDSFQRPIDYLRISVTDRCNMRCVYCMPAEGVPLLAHSDILSYEEITAIVRIAVQLGISKVRLSGGEPLLRSGITGLVRSLAAIDGLVDLSLTTNGTLLAGMAHDLKEAGLRRVNVSLDSLRQETFHSMTRLGDLASVLRGIAAAKDAGLTPVKTNTVVIRGVNDNEILDFARKTIDDGWNVRFIELMPFALMSADRVVSTLEIRQRLETLGRLEPAQSIGGNGPARYFRFVGATGSVGFISPVTEHFCFGCNRLRLTADGGLRPCLLINKQIDLREAIRGKDEQKVKQLIQEAVASKPRQHQLLQGNQPESSMSHIGG